MVIWAKPHLGKWQPWRHLCEICQGYFTVGIHTAWYLVRDHPDDRNHASLGILYGYIGRKRTPFAKAAERLSSARRAQTPLTECNARAIWLWFTRVTGETDQALTLIERLLQTPGATLRAEFIMGASRRLNYACAGNGTRCEATHVSKITRRTEAKTIY
ncbi:MAG: hypothetical protein DME43_10690 [Verrucomicrobia bacterium]|nr:MAG: hypothetical protein DME43_10690 [Verrucomicrobiota bacterium]